MKHDDSPRESLGLIVRNKTSKKTFDHEEGVYLCLTTDEDNVVYALQLEVMEVMHNLIAVGTFLYLDISGGDIMQGARLPRSHSGAKWLKVRLNAPMSTDDESIDTVWVTYKFCTGMSERETSATKCATVEVNLSLLVKDLPQDETAANFMVRRSRA